MRYLIAMLMCFSFLASVDAGEDMLCQRLVQALAENNYDGFMQFSSQEMRENISTEMFSNISGQLAFGAYNLDLMGSLQREGCTETIWKLSAQESPIDLLVRLVVAEDQVIGFWIN